MWIRVLFAQDSDEKRGFLFDNVWPILKDAENWADVLPKQQQQPKAFQWSHGEIPTPKSLEASYSVDLNANDDQAHVDMQANSSSSRLTGRKKKNVIS